MFIFLTTLFSFIFIDALLKRNNIKGEYYIVHSITNMIVVKYTFNNFIKAYYELTELNNS